MQAFVTGGTGFIGGRLVQRLQQRGYSVAALVRSSKDAQAMQAQGVTPILGDIRDRESLRAGMQGADVVFHVAAWYKIGSPDWQTAEEINVDGTRNVLGLAQELGVPRIVYTSTVAVYGDTRGKVVTEADDAPQGPLLTEYDRTKWKAHFEVALSLIRQGAPITIVMPGAVYGPGDHSAAAEMMEAYFKGFFPLFPAPQLTLTFAHIDDIVDGHILAAEKGRPGESYFLVGPIYTMRQMVDMWAEISRRPRPFLYLPPALVKPFTPLLGWVNQRSKLPTILSEESARMIDATYIALPDKAERELGWRARPVYEGMRETLNYLEETLPAPSPQVIRGQQAAVAALVFALFLGIVWRLVRRR